MIADVVIVTDGLVPGMLCEQLELRSWFPGRQFRGAVTL